MITETLDDARTTTRKRAPSDGIRTVTSSTFASLVQDAKGPVVVEFMTYGCSHCQAIEPILQQVAEMVKSKEKIFRVNIAVERELADRYAIQGTPTLIMFLNGAEVARDEGPHPTVSTVLSAITQPFES
jgi:thioredoxin 1